MDLGMAACATGHEFRPVLFYRIIGMKAFMTVLAGKTMQPTVILQISVNARMALATLHCGQGCRIRAVEILTGFGNYGLFRRGRRRNYLFTTVSHGLATGCHKA